MDVREKWRRKSRELEKGEKLAHDARFTTSWEYFSDPKLTSSAQNAAHEARLKNVLDKKLVEKFVFLNLLHAAFLLSGGGS